MCLFCRGSKLTHTSSSVLHGTCKCSCNRCLCGYCRTETCFYCIYLCSLLECLLFAWCLHCRAMQWVSLSLCGMLQNYNVYLNATINMRRYAQVQEGPNVIKLSKHSYWIPYFWCNMNFDEDFPDVWHKIDKQMLYEIIETLSFVKKLFEAMFCALQLSYKCLVLFAMQIILGGLVDRTCLTPERIHVISKKDVFLTKIYIEKKPHPSVSHP